MQGVPANFRNASDVNSGDWETVKNTKKDTYEKRQEKRVLQASVKKIEKVAGTQGNLYEFLEAPPKAANAPIKKEKIKAQPKKTQKQGVIEEIDMVEVLDNKKKRGPKKKKVAPPQIANENDLVQMILSILNNTPHNYLDLGDVGTKLQAISGGSWNTKFKKKYGTLQSFIQKRKEFFFDQQNHHVYLKAKWEAAKKEQEEQKAKKVAKKQRQKDKATAHEHNGSEKSNEKVEHKHLPKPTESNNSSALCCFFILLVFITIIFLLTLFILYNQESFKKVKLNGEFFKTLTKGLTKTWKRGMKSINPYFNHIKTMIEGYLGSKKS